jgi:hypothetical protein
MNSQFLHPRLSWHSRDRVSLDGRVLCIANVASYTCTNYITTTSYLVLVITNCSMVLTAQGPKVPRSKPPQQARLRKPPGRLRPDACVGTGQPTARLGRRGAPVGFFFAPPPRLSTEPASTLFFKVPAPAGSTSTPSLRAQALSSDIAVLRYLSISSPTPSTSHKKLAAVIYSIPSLDGYQEFRPQPRLHPFVYSGRYQKAGYANQ